MPGGCYKASQIGSSTTTEAYDCVGAREASITDNRPATFGNRDTLRGFRVRHIDANRLQARCGQQV